MSETIAEKPTAYWAERLREADIMHERLNTFREFLDKFLIIYLDDLLIYSDTLAEHKRHVRAVLDQLRKAGLCLKPSKCQFHVQEVAFLGFIVGSDGIKMDPSKVAAITRARSSRSAESPRSITLKSG